MNPSRQSGNVLFIIFIGIALFAALSFAVSRGMRSGGESVSKEKASIYASEIIQYGNEIATAVKAVKALNGCSDTQISFEGHNSTSINRAGVDWGTYANANAPAGQTCHIFSQSGGSVTPKKVSPEAVVDPSLVPAGNMHPSSWIVSATRVSGNGGDTGANGTDLLLWVGRVKKDVCIEINKKLGIDNPGGEPPVDPWDCPGAAFDGTYQACSDPIGDTVTSLSGKKAFCVGWDNTGIMYNYMQVLIAR